MSLLYSGQIATITKSNNLLSTETVTVYDSQRDAT
jgi:hypothetical protein